MKIQKKIKIIEGAVRVSQYSDVTNLDQFICTDCIKDGNLREFIVSNGYNGCCNLCKSHENLVINCKEHEFRNIFKVLMRFYYSQWDYDPHIGGEDIRSFFNKENLLLNEWKPMTEENADDLWNVVSEIVDHDKGYNRDNSVYLYSDSYYRAIKDNYCSKIKKIEKQLDYKNYYEIEKEVVKLLNSMIRDTEQIVPKGVPYFRARIGYEKKACINDNWSREEHFQPYQSSNIGSVPPTMASNGRVNRQGISFLYLASDVYTSVAEVRPYPGQYVSVGKFICNQNIRVADFSNIDIKKYCCESKLDILLTLSTINELFSRPAPNPTGKQYRITQLLADVIRQLGYDGVQFKSSVGNGINLAIFRPAFFDYIKEGASVNYLKAVKYTYDTCEIMRDDIEYLHTES